MKAKPGRPRKKRERAKPQSRRAPRLPSGLTPDQRAHMRELLGDPQLSPAALLQEYLATLRMRDRAKDELESGLLIETERGGKKTSPAWQIFNQCSNRLLRLRSLMRRPPGERDEAAPAPGSYGELRVQETLTDPASFFLVDDQGAPEDEPDPSAWRSDPRLAGITAD